MTRYKHLFLNLLPPVIEAGTLYVSMDFGTVIHLCACGCGRKVVTPLSPRDWKLIFDGDSVTLSPSIGNWQYPCRSHYWIRRSRIEWAYDSGRPADHDVMPSVDGEQSPTEDGGVAPLNGGNRPGFLRRWHRRWRW
jgi:hypothetical protein